MTTFLFAALLAVLALLIATEHAPPNADAPLVQASGCAPLPNPCDKIDCRKPDTKRIA